MQEIIWVRTISVYRTQIFRNQKIVRTIFFLKRVVVFFPILPILSHDHFLGCCIVLLPRKLGIQRPHKDAVCQAASQNDQPNHYSLANYNHRTDFYFLSWVWLFLVFGSACLARRRCVSWWLVSMPPERYRFLRRHTHPSMDDAPKKKISQVLFAFSHSFRLLFSTSSSWERS